MLGTTKTGETPNSFGMKDNKHTASSKKHAGPMAHNLVMSLPRFNDVETPALSLVPLFTWNALSQLISLASKPGPV